MTFRLPLRTSFIAFTAIVSVVLAAPSVSAQDAKNGEKAAAEAAKEAQRKVDQFEQAAKAIGGPGGTPECVWLGRRVVGLLWRDDLDTAFRHLDLYDRFGCPGSHVQAAFRCVIRQGSIDPKAEPDAPTSLNSRVHACWLDPAAATKPQTPPAPKEAPPEKEKENSGTEAK